MIKKFTSLFFMISIILAICSCAPTTIDTLPAGAAVYRADGQIQIGTTPYKTSIFLTEKNYTIRKDRYFDEPVKLNYDSTRVVELKLRPMPILVYSKPDAEIYPDGKETSIGRTPMKLKVYDKTRTYTLKAADYYDQNITVGSESADPIVVKLARRPIVTLSAAPEGVEIYENGKLIGAAPVREEILTNRTFELRKAGHFTKSVTLAGAPPYEVAVELKPFPIITVTASPAGAQIYRTGGLIGKTPVKLAVGEKTVLEVRSDRCYSQSVTLTPESPAQVSVELKAMPYVMINSAPAGTEVFIGEKSVGSAPVELLIEKDTVVELRKEGFITKTATLTGADKQVTVTLEAVPPPPETNAVQAVEQETAAVEKVEAKSSQKGMLWAFGGAALAAIGLIVFLIKRDK